MIKKGMKVFPYIGNPIGGGKWTSYRVENKNIIDHKRVPSGWLTIIAEGNHPLEEKSGTGFRIKEITAVNLSENPKKPGQYFVTVFAEIDWEKKINRNEAHLEDDIPEDF